MDKILVCGLIACLVSIAVPIFTKDRNFYLFSIAVVFLGLIIAVWANSNSKVGFGDYIRADISIDSAAFDETNQQLEIFADGRRFLLPRQNLSLSDIEIIQQEGPKLTGLATVWLRPNNETITGLTATNLSIDARTIADVETSFYGRITNVGIGISILGLLLIPFHYFTTPKRSHSVTLTQKY